MSATFGRSAAGKRRGCGKNINWRNRHGETMLHKLVTYGTVEEIEQLIRQGADVNARDNAGSFLICQNSLHWHVMLLTSYNVTVPHEVAGLNYCMFCTHIKKSINKRLYSTNSIFLVVRCVFLGARCVF